jgi:CubicO group peptidase (beta-lactamase class C family)
LSKKRRRILSIIGLILLLIIVYYAWISLPIISGYSAKLMCTCAYVSGRDKEDIDSTDLGEIPFNLAPTTLHAEDSSVTASVLGLARQKAIYRSGLGCTLVNEHSEKEIRGQKFNLPQPGVSADTVAWPMGNRIFDATRDSTINFEKLRAAVDKVFTEPYPEKKQRTRAVVVVYDGRVVAEKYAAGFDSSSIFYGWSMAKSFTSALIGILVKQGKLDIDKPAPVPEWNDTSDLRHTITIRDLLQQASGLDFEENYSKSSDVTRMLFQKGDMAAYAASHKLANKPGRKFSYSSGNSNILARIIRHTTGETNYPAFPMRELFYKAGMYHSSFEPDASGTYVGSSYINATARDYARFGLLYLNDGVVNGERILPEGWVNQTVTPSNTNPLKNYGFQFWLNGLDKDGKRKYPEVPDDMYYCDGFANQFIFIIPSEKLVVVRLGLTFDRSFNENEFLKAIIASVHGS